MYYRYLIVTFRPADEDATDERLRELGLESWELVSVLPGSRDDPDDKACVTMYFRRDASTDINL